MKKEKVVRIPEPARLDMEELRKGPFMAPTGEVDINTSLEYWYPRLLTIDAPRLNMPKTRILRGIDWWDLGDWWEGKKPKHIDRLVEKITNIVDAEFGWPFFLRTDYMSNKHEWENSCYVTGPGQIAKSIFNIFEMHGLATVSIQSLVIREFIEMKTMFKAFPGNMPINREFRFFVKGGLVSKVQPYWPELSIENHIDEKLYPDWKKQLRDVSMLTPDEYLLLAQLACKVSEAVGADRPWSVDFSQDIHGDWWLIDMAREEVSYKWKPGFPVLPEIGDKK